MKTPGGHQPCPRVRLFDFEQCLHGLSFFPRIVHKCAALSHNMQQLEDQSRSSLSSKGQISHIACSFTRTGATPTIPSNNLSSSKALETWQPPPFYPKQPTDRSAPFPVKPRHATHTTSTSPPQLAPLPNQQPHPRCPNPQEPSRGRRQRRRVTTAVGSTPNPMVRFPPGMIAAASVTRD